MFVLSKMKPQPYVEDIWKAVAEDQTLGAAGPVIEVEERHLEQMLLCRRLTVIEEREKRCRTRCVDPETEFGLIPAPSVSADRYLFPLLANMSCLCTGRGPCAKLLDT